MSSYTSQDIYTPTDWEDYPSTATKITASRLNKMERSALEAAKETSTFLINSLFGGLKSTIYLDLSISTGKTVEGYDPQNGDKLVVWQLNRVPCIEGTDYTITQENGVYKIQGTTWIGNVCIELWNIPTSSGGGVSGSAYTALPSLTTESISGTATQEQEGE